MFFLQPQTQKKELELIDVTCFSRTQSSLKLVLKSEMTLSSCYFWGEGKTQN